MKLAHVVPVKIYWVVFGALLALTLITTGIAFIDLGGVLNSAVALSIAILKAVLVVLFFMHVRYSSRATAVVLTAGVFWMVVLLVLTMSDYLTR